MVMMLLREGPLFQSMLQCYLKWGPNPPPPPPRGYDSSHFGWDQTHGKFIWHYLAISKATAGEKHPQSGSQGACGSKNDPEATPEYKKMEKNSEKTAFFTFWPLWAK